MKITNINDITDESLKQLSASSVSDFIEEEIKKVSDQFEAKRAQKLQGLSGSIEVRKHCK